VGAAAAARKGDGHAARGCGHKSHGVRHEEAKRTVVASMGGAAAGGARAMRVLSRGGVEEGFFQFRVGSDMESKGGPYGYIGWVCVGWVRKKFRFWQKHSPDYDYVLLCSPSPYPIPKTYDGWVRHER
jgi:hypothetical protein